MKEEKIPTIGILKGIKMDKLSEIGKIIKLSKKDIFKILASYSLNFDEMESLFLWKDEIPLSMLLKDIDLNDSKYMDNVVKNIYDYYISQRNLNEKK